MNDFLTVKVDSKISGVLSFEENEYIFSYKTEDKKDFISLTMPVRAKSWNSKNLHPLFEMHLPEGYLLSIIKKHFSLQYYWRYCWRKSGNISSYFILSSMGKF